MSIDIGLRTLLLAQTSITALVPAQSIGGIPLDCIFNEEPSEGVLPPFIVITQIGEDPMLTLDGTYGMRMTEFSVDCYHNTLPNARAMSTAVQDFLNDYDGAAGAADTINAVLLQGVTYDKLYNQDGTDKRQRVVKIDYQIQHTDV